MSDDKVIPFPATSNAWPTTRTANAWPAPPRREKAPPAMTYEELHWGKKGSIYGPHICPQCYGAGWMRSETEIGTLHRCDRCAALPVQIDNTRLGELWRLSGLNPNAAAPATFDTFQPYDETTAAMRSAASRFVGKPVGWLTLYGNWGTGKSHLGEAITRWLLGKRVACLYMRAPDLFSYLGAVERNPEAYTDYENRMYWVQRTTVLVVDEWGKEKESDTVMKLRTSLFDFRYQRSKANEGGATVLLSNLAPDEWSDPAIADRSAQFVQIHCNGKSYRRIK